MSSFQGTIRKSVNNALLQFEKIGYASQNFANFNTNGYKSVSFDEIMTTEGYTKTVVRTNTAQGGFMRTNKPLDICIQGAGYIPVTSPEGNIYYTRDGNFTIDKNGVIKRTSGDIVGGGIVIDANAEKIEIKKDGTILSYKTKTSKGEHIGTIPLVVFNNPEALKEVGGNKYEKTEESGEATLQKDHDKIAQWGIERSNVDMYNEVTGIMRTNAQLIAQYRLIKQVSEIYKNGIEIIGG